MTSTPPQFTSVLHKLAESAEWDQLAQYLHTLQSSSDNSIVKLLLTCEGPHAWTPLMLSCARAPPDIIQLLLASCPQSVKTADRSGTYPLHFVCSWKAGVEEEQEKFELRKVLELLLEFGPEVINMQNQWGQTPLHCIFDNEDLPSLETLRILLGLHSETDEEEMASSGSENFEGDSSKGLKSFASKALATQDTNSYLPLHLAASKGASADILRLLISIYPTAAMTATTSGDLPIHVLQYHAEDTAREDMDGLLVRQGSWRGGSGVFRLKKSKTFDVTTLDQVEALLEPLCLTFEKIANNSDDNGDYVDHSAAINLAMRLTGSRNVNLPIHIAAEHGASFEILKAFCLQNPEGPATPQPISKSMIASSCSSLSAVEDAFKSPEIFPIESFQKGRAAIEASQAADNVIADFEDANGLSVDKNVYEKSKGVLKSFEDRSDLLFAFYPDAVPSIFRESKKNDKVFQKVPFRKDLKRLQRLEQLIRYEALDSSSDTFSLVARYVWLWLYRGINSTDDEVSREFQGSVGRIITGCPEQALLKLSFISHIANDLGISLEQDLETLKDVPCLIQGKTIIQYAGARDPNMTMNAILVLNESEERNFVHTLCEYLDANSALAFSNTCRRTVKAGVRLFPEVKLKETGRTWNLPGRDELLEPQQTECWQHLDSKLMLLQSTHTVFITYYLEVSELASTDAKENNSSSENRIGGLLVTSEDVTYADEREATIEAQHQKRLVHSQYLNLSGCEVQLSFEFKPGRSYSLRVYGSGKGGRVSISNARARQVVYCLDRHKRTPLQVLLTSKPEYLHSPLATQITTLIDERYGFSDITSSFLLHFALRNKVSTDVLEAFIASNPSLLLETDSAGRTPLHAVFMMSKNEAPTLGTVKLLLQTPGENATKLKDRDYKVPLHIAAEIGASNAILELLTDAYPDGCYRQTRDGDLPVHFLVRSGNATTASVEMLLRPIMDSETICSISGGQGLQLPLHIAAQYNCSYEVLERLLSAFGAAASIPGRRSESSEDEYPIDVFESNRAEKLQPSPTKSQSSTRTLGEESIQRLSNEAANYDLEEADFNLRSDLIFVHYPLTPGLHRQDKNRIRRLRNLIRREACDCVEQRKVYGEMKMSTMTRLAWCFFCTYQNSDDLNDHYADEVGSILKSLSIPAVKLLASVTNPFSSPPHQVLSDCATEKCKKLITIRVLFVGRFTFDENNFVLHKSHESVVVKAKDYGAADSYKKLLSTFKQEEQLSDIDALDFDDLDSVTGGSIVHVLSCGDDTLLHFVDFAMKIGLDEDFARQEFDLLVSKSNGIGDDESRASEGKGDLTLDVFREFCSAHNVDRNGVRDVVIKFMKHRRQFLREKVSRARLNLSKSDWYVFPVIEDYDIDRAEDDEVESVDEIMPKNSWVFSERKDNFFATDLKEMNEFGYDFSSFSYALVLPRGDRDLNDMTIHEELEIWEVRDLALKVGNAIKEMHTRHVIHGNLTLSNIVKLGSHVAIIDLESATLSGEGEWSSTILSDKIAGISQKVASSMLPPEVIGKIDLSENSIDLQKHERYWGHVHDDAIDLDLLNPDDIRAISRAIKSLQDQIEVLKSSRSSSSANIRSSLNPKVDNPEDCWRDKVSEALDSISTDDLPISLSSCQTFQDFTAVWTRLKTNQILWSRIRPRLSPDGKCAYVVKFYNDMENTRKSKVELPYDIVQSSNQIDVWGFGVLLFSLCSRSTLFHQTLDGDLQGTKAYEQLHNWNSDFAKFKIKSAIKNPIAQDLLLKILTRKEERMPSMTAVLRHPFFGPWSSPAARKILEDCDDQLLIGESSSEDASSEAFSSPSDEMESILLPTANIPSPTSQESAPHFNHISMEKICKIVFARLDDIKVPTGFIILPYKLEWNDTRHIYEAPMDSRNLAKAEKIGKHLLNINTLTAKLYFWLRVKENLAEEKGKEFKAKIINWIQRAREEGSETIAEEIVSAVNHTKAFEAICIEMLDEEMNISHARAFIRDPMKAAAMLIHEEVVSLLECYEDQFMYIIDEHRGCPSLAFDALSISFHTDGTYPIKIQKEENELEEFLLPFINIAVMIATANDGLNGLARLLGLNTSAIPKEWNEGSLGLVHKQNPSVRSSIIEFATIQRVVRREFKGLHSNVYIPQSIETTRRDHDLVDTGSELNSLQAFYQRQDPLGYYTGLHRVYDSRDESLVFWTQDEDPMSFNDRLEFSDGLKSIDQLKDEIVDKNKLEEELIQLNKRLLESKERTEAKLHRRRQKKVRVVSPASIPEDNPVRETADFLIPPQEAQSSAFSGPQMKSSSLHFTTTPTITNPPCSNPEEEGNGATRTQQNFVI